jgi:uncharacterized protein YkwD
MLRASVICFATLALAHGNCTAQSAGPAASNHEFSKSLRNQPSPQVIAASIVLCGGGARPRQDGAESRHHTASAGEDPAAENELLELANKSREQAGAPPLHMDETLRQAARQHAQLMITRDHLDHQYAGEPELLHRIATAGPLKMDYAGENLASANGAAAAHEALMRSPPHRHNLLDSGFDVAGIAALWRNGQLYVVQDFGHEIHSYSAREGDKIVSQAVAEIRQHAGLSKLKQLAPPKLDEATCSLSQGSRPDAHLISAAYSNLQVIAYTQSRPEVLPPVAVHLLSDPGVQQFAVGACYARNAAYPNGTYWIAILLH